MSTHLKKRHRTHSRNSYKRRQPIMAQAAIPARMGKAEMAACTAIVVVAAAMISLIWLMAGRAAQDYRAEVRERTEQMLSGQAAVMAQTVVHEIDQIDQSLTILQSAWEKDPDHFSLTAWKQSMPALMGSARDLFIADDQLVIQQDILPQAVGQGVSAAYSVSLQGSLEHFEDNGTQPGNDGAISVQPSIGFEARQFLMYIVRPLSKPKGWLIGASYKSDELTKLFANANLGINPVLALIETRNGGVQAIVGPAARQPSLNIAQTPLYEALKQHPNGIWGGASPIDDAERLHAFQAIPGRDMTVVVGVSALEARALSDSLVNNVHGEAAAGTVLVLFAAALLMWEIYSFRTGRRRVRQLARNRMELERLRAEEDANRVRTQLSVARMRVLMDASGDGIGLFDGDLRLSQWNRAFLQRAGVELRMNMPLDAILRAQAVCGLLEAQGDVEAAIARHVEALRSGEGTGIALNNPNAEGLVMRSLPIQEGGCLIMLSATTWHEPAPADPATTPVAEDAAATVDRPYGNQPPAPAAVLEW